MGEMGIPNEYDEVIIASSQEKMAEKIKDGGSEDLKYINVNDLGGNEMNAFGLLERLSDGSVTLEMFKDKINQYEDEVRDTKSLLHYYAWLRNQAMYNLRNEQ